MPGRIVAIDGLEATVDFWGVQRSVRLDIVGEDVQVGDHILNHVGYAIRRIPDEEVAATLRLYDELLQELEQADLMAEDLGQELAAARPARPPREAGAADDD